MESNPTKNWAKIGKISTEIPSKMEWNFTKFEPKLGKNWLKLVKIRPKIGWNFLKNWSKFNQKFAKILLKFHQKWSFIYPTTTSKLLEKLIKNPAKNSKMTRHCRKNDIKTTPSSFESIERTSADQIPTTTATTATTTTTRKSCPLWSSFVSRWPAKYGVESDACVFIR